MRIDRMRVFMTRDKDRPRVIVALDTDDADAGITLRPEERTS